MLTQPSTKYRPFQPIDISNRSWPNRTLTAPPVWLSTDLRDGNQALIEPMDIDRKLRLFQTLVKIGFKEIEVGFPAASQTEFDFVRRLIEQNLIPEDVTIQVLTPARDALVRRTFASLKGVKQAIVHVYNATAPTFRSVVFNRDKAGTIHLATEAASLIKQLAVMQPETRWRFQYSPEVFTSTELSFAKEICNAVLSVWQPTTEAKAIINLPASVEVSTPNMFADQVEWMNRHLDYREAVVLCVHPHNDRGCSVAAAELAQLAGAERVEGCLFGNGERTGNVDLVTLAMNLYTQGISPGLDFSQIDEIVRVAQDCTQLSVHPRHPYAGELVFTAFSGSHQDAIRKGFAIREPDSVWEVPYLPMDPADVGRSYESVVRVNSQSGKGGIAFLLEQDYGVRLPRKLQIEFSGVVQVSVDASGKEVSAQTIWEIFQAEYCLPAHPLQYVSHQSTRLADQRTKVEVMMAWEGREQLLCGIGNGPVDAFVIALNCMLTQTFSAAANTVEILHYEERSLKGDVGSQSRAFALVDIACQPIGRLSIGRLREPLRTSYGVGLHTDITAAAFSAVVSAVNRQLIQDIEDNPSPVRNLVSLV
ncbi:MAG: 2-isopropylmalate synthase [Cyanobacteria bacterium P01_D01_bin.105]